MTERKTLLWQKDGRVGRLTLNRPERLNALDEQMLTELLRLLDEVRRDNDLNVLVLTGAGRAFSSGVDIRSSFFMEGAVDDSVFVGMRSLNWQHELIESLYGLPQVTIAMVNGNAVGGGGFGLAMACDMRFALRSARFWAIPIRINVVQDFGLSWFLQRACGQHRAMEVVFGGQQVSGEEAEAWGIVNSSFETLEEMREHVERLAATIAQAGPDAVRMLKQVFRNGATSPLRDQLRLEAIANGLCFQSAEFQEAKRRYMEGLRK